MTSPDIIRASFIPRADWSGDVTPWEGTFDDLEAELRRDGDTRDGKEGRAVVISAFCEGDGQTGSTKGRRGRFRQRHLATETRLLGLDFDTRPDAATVILDTLQGAGLEIIAYSSYSHGIAAKGRAPRYRVLLPLTRSVTATEYRALFLWADAYVGGGSDRQVKDVTRLFYTPRRKAPDAELAPWIVRHRGACLNPDALPDGGTVAALLGAQSIVAADAPHAPLRPADIEKRLEAWGAAAPEVRARGAAFAAYLVQQALQAAAEDTERRPAFFRAAVAIGKVAHLLGEDEAERAGKVALDITSARLLGDMDGIRDLERQLKNGLKLGADNLLSADEVKALTSGPHRTKAGRRRLPILQDDADALPLEDARERVREVIAQALATRGVFSVAADPGAGKTRAILDELPDLWLGGKTVRIAVPTNKFAKEVLAEARSLAAHKLGMLELAGFREVSGIEPKRHDQNCQNFAAVNAGRRAGGIDGVREVCSRCDLHPRNSRSMTACSFFRDVMRAREWMITVTTHALEVERAKAMDAGVFVDVAAFRKAAKEDGRYRPAAEWTLDGLALTLTPDPKGSAPPVLEGDGDEVEAQCREWLACADGRETDDTLEALTRKLADDAQGGVSLLVIDERPKAADEKREVRETDLLTWLGAGDLAMPDTARDELRALFVAARTMKRTVSADELTRAAAPGALSVRRVHRKVDSTVAKLLVSEHAAAAAKVLSTVARRLLDEHADDAARGKIPRELLDAPDVEALGALEDACQRGWTGCYIGRDGVLHLLAARPIGRAGAQATVYLDGTATAETARALLGPDCEHTRIRVQLHADTVVHQVRWSASKSQLPQEAKPERETTRSRAMERLEAVVCRYESPTTAWVLHKAWCDDVGVRHTLKAAFDADRVTYFGAADAVGSNRLLSCTRIVLADWHTPYAAQAAAGEVLAMRAQGNDTLDGVDWLAQAAHQLEGAEIVQAAWRVRPAENAREIVMLTSRELPAWWPTPVEVDADELVADELGKLPSGRKGAAMWLAREVRARGAVALQRRVTHEVPPAYSYIGEPHPMRDTAFQCAARAWKAAGGSIATWAEAAGCQVAFARTSDGRQAVPIVWQSGCPAPTAAEVAGLLHPTPRWVEWREDRVTIEDGTGAALEALAGLTADRCTFDELGRLLGVSASTVRRRLRLCGIDSLEGLRARWREAQTPDHVVIDDDDDGEARIAIVGSLVWLQRAPPHDVRRWHQLTEPPDRGRAAA